MIKSQSIGSISDALSKAQGQFNAAIKDSTNPHFKSKYADLASCIDATRKALSDNNLAVSQFPSMIIREENTFCVKVITLLSHSSGEFFESEIIIPLGQVTPQSVGSSITYARRYSYAALLQISQEDDDANAAQPTQPIIQTARKKTEDQLFDSTSLAHQKTLKYKLEALAMPEKYGEFLLKFDKKPLSEIEPFLKSLKGENKNV